MGSYSLNSGRTFGESPWTIASTSGYCQEAIYLLTFALRDFISRGLQKRFGPQDIQQKVVQALQWTFKSNKTWKKLPSSTLKELDFSDLLSVFKKYWQKKLKKAAELVDTCRTGRNNLSHQQINSWTEGATLLDHLLKLSEGISSFEEQSAKIRNILTKATNEINLGEEESDIRTSHLRESVLPSLPQQQGSMSIHVLEGIAIESDEEYPMIANVNGLKQKGDQLLNEGLLQEALEKFTEAILMSSSDAALYAGRSKAWYKIADCMPQYYEYARQDAEDAIAWNSKEPEYYHLLGQALEKLELFYVAIDAYEEGLRLEPENPELESALQKCKATIQNTESLAEDLLQKLAATLQSSEEVGAILEETVQPSVEFVLTLVKQANSMTEACKNLPKAAQLYETAAKLGNAEAAYKLGHCYLDGNGVAPDPEKALKWLQKTAKMTPTLTEVDGLPVVNNAVVEGQNTLGVMYRDGIGVKSDKRAAMAWFEKAAAHGHPFAQYNLCCCYLVGDGLDIDYDKALHWCTEAANAGLMTAQYKLGEIYEKGLGVPVSYESARNWYQRAAEMGHRSAVNALQLLKLKEDVVKDPVTLCNLAARYIKGDYEVPRDLREAERLFKMAAERGYGEAHYRLANFYADEMHDQKEAFQWLRKVAKKGDPRAEIQLARFYNEGRGCQRDPEEAKKWALEAMTHGLDQEAEMLIDLIEAENADIHLKAGFVHPEERVLEKFEKESGLESTGVSWKERQRRFFGSIVPPQFPNMVQQLEALFNIKSLVPFQKPPGGVLGTICRTKQSKTALRYVESASYMESALTEAIQRNFEKAVQWQYKALRTWSPFSNVLLMTTVPIFVAINSVLHENPDSPEAKFCHLFLPREIGPFTISATLPYVFSISHAIGFHETVEIRELNGYVRFLEDDYVAAKRDFTRSLQENNANIELYYFRALATLLAGALEAPSSVSAVICDFQQYLAKAEPDAEFVPEAYYEIGKAFLYLGDANRAMHCYDLGRAAEDPEVRLPIFYRVHYGHKTRLEECRQRLERTRQGAMAKSGRDLSKYPTSDMPGLVCFHCLKETSGMRRCRDCKIAFYCSRSCQKANCKQHRVICTP